MFANSREGAPEAHDEDTRAMQIAAAQLRLVTDRRLGKTTPDWVKSLAAEKPHSPRPDEAAPRDNS